MTAVLVALAPRLNSEALLEDVERLTAAGQDVHLVSWVPPSAELEARLTEVVVLSHKPVATTEDEVDEEADAADEAAGQDALEQAVEPMPVGDLLPAPKVEEALLHHQQRADASQEAGRSHHDGPAGSGAQDGDPAAEGDVGPDGEVATDGEVSTDGEVAPDGDTAQDGTSAADRDGTADGEDAAGDARRRSESGLPRVLVVASRAARSPRPYARRAYKLSRRRVRMARRFLKLKRRRLRSRVQRPLATTAFFTDQRARRLTSSADVLVAVDSTSVLAVWSLVRRRRAALGVVGTAAAVTRVRTGDPGPA